MTFTDSVAATNRRVNHTHCVYARAQGGHADSATSVSRPTRTIWLRRLGGAAALGDIASSLFREILFRGIRWRRRWSSGDPPAVLDGNQLRGHRQQIGKSAAL
jgi:hypothetical protein